MGGMMGSAAATGVWIPLWSLLGLAVALTAGILAVRALSARHRSIEPQVDRGDSVSVRQAKDALRLRYASGEISREEFLPGRPARPPPWARQAAAGPPAAARGPAGSPG